MTAKSIAYKNDQFNLENMPFVGEPQIGDQLELNVTKQVTLNLLDFYSRQQLANFLSFGTGDFSGDGRILLTYADDAIVSGAALRLIAKIPEPATLSLLLLGLLPISYYRKKSGKSH
ncbi:MAG: PEP-CTERM sorting domain-containing protein [Burkholderiales bacterium]|nr:PEP-CTERM sorting domain-containing protein [Burkholderiales bacterium]